MLPLAPLLCVMQAPNPASNDKSGSWTAPQAGKVLDVRGGLGEGHAGLMSQNNEVLFACQHLLSYASFSACASLGVLWLVNKRRRWPRS